ncbi:MAG: methyltransferase [Pseudonocardiaceae bacterium]
MAHDNMPEVTGVLSWFPLELPVRQSVLGLFVAKWIIGALRPLVQLNVPDLLSDGPLSASDIADATGTDADALYRVLRCTASAGILVEGEDGRFGLTPAAEGLRSDVHGSSRDMFLFVSDPMLWRPCENVLHTVRTGEPSFDNQFGMSFYEYLKANPASNATHRRAMLQNRFSSIDRILAEYDFGRFARIADVGGGVGQFLAEVLKRHPQSTGVLCDQPHVVVEAKDVVQREGVADRVTLMETDFFTQVAEGCDAYLIKYTLHNWNDEKAELILRRIREAIGDNSEARLVVIELLLSGRGQWDLGKLIDIDMLTLGGRMRDLEDWKRLAATAGFELVNDPTPGDLVLLEFRPA